VPHQIEAYPHRGGGVLVLLEPGLARPELPGCCAAAGVAVSDEIVPTGAAHVAGDYLTMLGRAVRSGIQ
jgi:hypothetical protein